MQRLRLTDVRSRCAAAAGLCSDDEKVPAYINAAIERLLYMGKWQGTYGRWRVCVRESCITWPREIETIEAYSACCVPGTIRNEWFEFLGSGPGRLDCDSCGSDLVDHGEACAFDDVIGTGKKIAVYSDVTEASTKRIILQFMNSSGLSERTQFNGEWIDGESIALPAAGTYAYTTHEVAPGGLVRVIKPITNGTIRLYEYETATALLRPLAYYAPDEEVPAYRRSLIPNMANTGGDCGYNTVEVMGKLRFYKVAKDNDFLLIGHAEALRLAVRAIKEEESDRWNEAAANWASAVHCLQKQLSHYLGDGAVQPIKMEGRETWGAGVTNLQ